MKGDIRQALDYLNENQIRATYTAVQSYLGFGVLDKVDWAEILGPRRHYASWVVNKKTGLPTGYGKEDIHPDLSKTSKIITKGRQLQAAVDEYTKSEKTGDPGGSPKTSEEIKVEVADCHGNNCAVICPYCEQAYVVSGFLNKGIRKCPHCEKSTAVFKDVKEEWEASHQDDLINPEQTATRLIFKKEWLGYDVWVTFTEGDVTYRYPHDQLLQTFISRLGIIEGTKSWKSDGVYHFPRLSGEQKKMLQRYVMKSASQPAAKGGEMVIPLSPDSITEREWNFRDDNKQHFYGDIPVEQQTITLTLNWKPDKKSEAKLVGKYKIDLGLLLSEGYVQKSNRGIRLRFQRTENDIEVAVDHGSPSLVVGHKPES